MLIIPDLNRLKVFYAVYEHRSIVRAADTLHVTRSAVSQSLKTLEDEIQTVLFVRDSKKVQPTQAAEALFHSVKPLLQELEATLRHIESGRKSAVGLLRLGAPLDFGSDHLTEVIAAFRAENPAVTFELVLGVPARQLDLLIQGQIDIAFIDNGDVFTKSYPISVEPVQSEEFVLVSSAKFYAEKINGDHSLTHLRNLPVVDYLPYAPVMRMWLKHHFGKSISELNVVYSAESVRAVLKAIALGMGVGVIPAHLVESNKSKLKIISTKKKELVNQIALALPLVKKLTYTERAFISFYKSFTGA